MTLNSIRKGETHERVTMPELISIRVNIIELERRKYNDICAESRSEAQEAVAQSAAV